MTDTSPPADPARRRPRRRQAPDRRAPGQLAALREQGGAFANDFRPDASAALHAPLPMPNAGRRGPGRATARRARGRAHAGQAGHGQGQLHQPARRWRRYPDPGAARCRRRGQLRHLPDLRRGRHRRRRRRDDAHPHRRAHRARRQHPPAGQVAAPAAGQVARPERYRDPLPATLCRPDRLARRARRVPAALAHHRLHPRLPGGAGPGVHGSGNADDARHPRRGHGAPVQDPPQRPGHRHVPVAPGCTAPGGAGSSASTRSTATSATKASRPGTTPNSPCSSSTRPMPATARSWT